MKLIESPAECSLKVYIACRFDKKLSALIIEGEPTDEELTDAWENIETEFNDLCGTKSAELLQIDRINRHIARNEAVKGYFFCLDEVLRRANAPYLEVLQRLKLHGVNIKWDNDIEKYRNNIESERKRDRTNAVKLTELNSQLQKLKTQAVHGKDYSRRDFYTLKQAIQALVGYVISETETNLFDFGVMAASYFEVMKNQSPN